MFVTKWRLATKPPWLIFLCKECMRLVLQLSSGFEESSAEDEDEGILGLRDGSGLIHGRDNERDNMTSFVSLSSLASFPLVFSADFLFLIRIEEELLLALLLTL